MEVKVWDDKVKKPKKDKKRKEKGGKRRGSSDSASSDLGLAEDEFMKIKEDKKLIKSTIKLIRKKIDMLGGGQSGIESWFRNFDKDKSDEVELNEFIKMMQYLKVVLEDRIGIMLFRVFDRANQGCFGLLEFTDVISKRMVPNYKRIIAQERERFRLNGLDIKWPNRAKRQP